MAGAGVQLLQAPEGGAQLHHRKEGGVGGGVGLEDDDAGDHHDEEDEAGGAVAWHQLGPLGEKRFSLYRCKFSITPYFNSTPLHVRNKKYL